jgi:hypothetical protein
MDKLLKVLKEMSPRKQRNGSWKAIKEFRRKGGTFLLTSITSFSFLL